MGLQQFTAILCSCLQEREFLKNYVQRIVDVQPNLVLVEKTVSRIAQDMLLEHGITLVINVKPVSISDQLDSALWQISNDAWQQTPWRRQRVVLFSFVTKVRQANLESYFFLQPFTVTVLYPCLMGPCTLVQFQLTLIPIYSKAQVWVLSYCQRATVPVRQSTDSQTESSCGSWLSSWQSQNYADCIAPPGGIWIQSSEKFQAGYNLTRNIYSTVNSKILVYCGCLFVGLTESLHLSERFCRLHW